ncbi:MAG: hypothetical protein IBJ10_01795 [Phycisphaerales bacterium]|nr:hypothetical protein [Phycisphaerales bacterium]
MSPPKRGPALYELIRDKPRVRVSVDSERPTREPAPMPMSGAGSGGSVFAAAGRSIRVPMGYVFLVVAAVIAMLFGAYSVGHSRASAKALADRRAQSAALLDEPAVADPLAQLGARVNPAGANPAPTQTRTAAPAPTTQAQRPPAGPGPNQRAGTAAATVGRDPRVAGLNYFICARLREEEAVRAAEFLSANGVAAAVTPADNASLRLVVATRGFSRDEMKGGEASALRSRITSLGRIYKSQHKGPTDFHDVYPEKHQP